MLYRVVYGDQPKEIWVGQVPYPIHTVHRYEVIEWCRENCKSLWYQSSPVFKQTFIEFDSAEDAFLFTLRWVGNE